MYLKLAGVLVIVAMLLVGCESGNENILLQHKTVYEIRAEMTAIVGQDVYVKGYLGDYRYPVLYATRESERMEDLASRILLDFSIDEWRGVVEKCRSRYVAMFGHIRAIGDSALAFRPRTVSAFIGVEGEGEVDVELCFGH